MRLYDYMVANEKGFDDSSTIRIVADRVARYIDAIPEDEIPDGRVFPADFYGRCRSPFPNAWVESVTKIKPNQYPHYPLGVRVWRGVSMHTFDEVPPDAPEGTAVFAGARCVVLNTCLKTNEPRFFVSPEVVIYLFWDADGFILNNLSNVPMLYHRNARVAENISGEELDVQKTGVMIAALIPFALLSFSLLLNRTTIEHTTPGIREKKIAQRYGVKSPLHNNYVLDVRPYSKTNGLSNASSLVSTQRGKSRAGVVHGHFRTYEESAPLFGRMAGTFWVPSHMRGNSEKGTITKSYRPHKERS